MMLRLNPLLLQHKWISMLFPEKLELNFKPNIPNAYLRCKVQKGALFHRIWEFLHIFSLCQRVVDLCSQI